MCQDLQLRHESNLVPVEVQPPHPRRGTTSRPRTTASTSSRDGILAVNVMGSPGAGKTAVLEATARAPTNRAKFAAIAGDLATEQRRRAPRRRRHPLERDHRPDRRATSTQRWCTTRCIGFTLKDVDYLFIENVGNLVCPAVYDLGQALNVVAALGDRGGGQAAQVPDHVPAAPTSS